VVVALQLGSLSDAGGGLFPILSLSFFIVSAILAAYSARPTRFYGSGGTLAGIKPYLNEHYCCCLLAAIGDRNDDQIRMNDRAIRRSAREFRASLIAALFAVAILYFDVTGIGKALTEWVGENQ
jgi:hypothetical protein